MSSSRTKFVNELFRISKNSKYSSNIDRYRAMGQKCKLTDYFNGHATNYLYNGNKNKPVLNEIDENVFVALNVEAPASEADASPIVPFFSIKLGNIIDSAGLRKKVLNISQDAADDEFLTCPDFMNGINGQGMLLEKVLFEVSIENHEISSISIPKLSAFDEEETESFKNNISSVISFLSNYKNKSFLNSWCKPFMQKNQTLFCNVRAVDRDHKLVSHSIFVAIFNSENMLKQWVAAYGEDALNIIAIVKSIFINDTQKKRLLESIKSAISAIMSRNMSHNLGSHYLYYTKANLETIAVNTRQNGPHVRGAAKVLSYIQGRMDYLATIVANDKYPYGSVNFKSQIWDELTVDDFSKRHYGNQTNEEYKEKLDKNKKSINRAISHAKNEIERLNSLINDIQNTEDINIISEKRTGIERRLTELYVQLNIIDQQNSYNRTTNYLLSNLIRSENYSRPDVLCDDNNNNDFRPLLLYVSLWNGSCYELFKGENNAISMEQEKVLKDSLSKINLALPGGTMSCHAFYNILENFIRNSAKYSWTGINADCLIFIVALRIDPEAKMVTFTIYDNKHDALKPRDTKHKKTLLEDLTTRLRCYTKILGENYSVDKANKGLKEMLFSAVWLKANESDVAFSNIIADIENASPRRKIGLIRKHAFELICVDDQGIETKDPTQANLALRFSLPLFTQSEKLDTKRIEDLKELVKLHTDVVEIPRDVVPSLNKLPRQYKQLFPRFYLEQEKLSLPNTKEEPFSLVKSESNNADSEREYLESSIKLFHSMKNNLHEIEPYKIVMGSFVEPGYNGIIPPKHQIYFSTHLSTNSSKKTIKDLVDNYAYVDTISGNNFTKTLEGLFSSGISDEGFYRTYSDLYFSLKITESALTRITIIDERLFNSIRWNVELSKKKDEDPEKERFDIRSTAIELSLKNVRVLNFLEKSRPGKNERAAKIVDEFPYFYGNKFCKTGPFSDYPNATNFLSIHLGLVEKMLKSKKLEKELGPIGQTPFSDARINKLMTKIKESFGYGESHKIHISIHSGRGNFSQELEGPLKEYPFISLASLESAFNNSKFLLSQLFYNTIFIGKGEINH